MAEKGEGDVENVEQLQRDPSDGEEIGQAETHTHDAVFGEITEGGPNYRSLSWIGAAGIMTKTELGLGILSLPAAFNTLGLIPGLICLIIVGIITTWTLYVVGCFKLNHRHVYALHDAGLLMFGKVGSEILGASLCLFFVFVAGSGFIGVSIGLNAVSSHATCTAIFVLVAALVAFMLASIRTLSKLSSLAWIGLICISTAILLVTFAVGFQDRPASAPQSGPWESDFKLVNKPSFAQAVSAISAMVFAYAGGPFVFGMISEMKEPRHFVRALILCRTGITLIYISVSCVIYYYCGSYVASPALGSAGTRIKKIAYGLALPGLWVSSTLLLHLSAKYVFVRILRGSKHFNSNSITHWSTWIACTFSIMTLAFIIANVIPVFNELVSLVGALLGIFISWQPTACMWFYDNWNRNKRPRTITWKFMVCWSAWVIAIGTFLMVAGTYGSILAIIKSYKKSGASAAFSCADNSNSV